MRTGATQPLDRFPLVNTSSADEMQAALSLTYAKPAMEFLDGEQVIRTTVNHRQLRHIGLVYASFGASLRLQYPETDLAAQIFLIGGKGEARTGGASVAISQDRSVVISPGEPLNIVSDPKFQRLVLTVKSESLAGKLAAIVGESCNDVLKFEPAQNYALPSARALRSHFLFLIETMNASVAPIPKIVLAEFEQTLIMSFLHANRNNYSHLLERAPPAVGSWQVRRAEEYIEANCRQAITLEISATRVARAFVACLRHSGGLAVVRSGNSRTRCDYDTRAGCCSIRTLLQQLWRRPWPAGSLTSAVSKMLISWLLASRRRRRSSPAGAWARRGTDQSGFARPLWRGRLSPTIFTMRGTSRMAPTQPSNFLIKLG